MTHAIEDYFERLYQRDDPYGYRNRWYEQRKRQLLLACLPRAHFGAGWEFGCSNGELSAQLATRCDYLLATDGNARAAQLAEQRLADFPHATAQHAHHPRDWPQGRFELIVFSEVGYFLPLEELRESVQRMRHSLTDDGLLVACHWLHPFDDAVTATPVVHEALESGLALEKRFSYRDEDLLLEGWGSGSWVARTEGLT